MSSSHSSNMAAALKELYSGHDINPEQARILEAYAFIESQGREANPLEVAMLGPKPVVPEVHTSLRDLIYSKNPFLSVFKK